MREDIAKLLAQREQTKELSDLLQTCKDKVKMSRDEMTKYYPDWDFADQVYRGKRKPDEADRKAAKRKEPQKMILPMTKSQVETFVAFGCKVYTQRPYVYELVPASDEDVVPARMGMATLERDLNFNKFRGVVLPQFMRGIAKYGVGILKETWWKKQTMTHTMVPDPTYVPNPQLPNIQPPMIEQCVTQVEYLGNKIINVSPYNFFPDPSVPLTRFQEGEFCASEEEQSFSMLEQMESDGIIAGVEFVKRTCDADTERRLLFAQKTPRDGMGAGEEKNARYGVLTEIQIVCNPSKTMIAPNVPMDKECNRMCKCLVWYVNDDRIVRIEPEMGYNHDEFTFSVAQYNNDGEQFINGGLAEDIGALQETATWFINAHVTSVRKVIDNRVLVDPKFVEMQDLIDRKSVIRTKPGASQNGMEKWFQQLNVVDVTQNHIKDVDYLDGAAKDATGVNENLIGQFSPGRRSASEANTVNSNAAARILLTVFAIWEIALVPQGHRMLTNLQQGLDIEQLIRVYGETRTMVDTQNSAMTDPAGQNAVMRFIPVDKSKLVGRFDFETFDGTLPSQRGMVAARLQELLVEMAKNPMSIPILGFDPALILNEILELSDVRNVNRLRLTPQRLQLFMSMAGATTNPGGPQQVQGGQQGVVGQGA